MDEIHIKMNDSYTATIRNINSLKNHKDINCNMQIVYINDECTTEFKNEVENFIQEYKCSFGFNTFNPGEVIDKEYINQGYRDIIFVGKNNKGYFTKYTMPQGKSFYRFTYYSGKEIKFGQFNKELKKELKNFGESPEYRRY